MHSPAPLTLPLMVQSGDGATSPEAEASRIACAFGGGLAAPRIGVFLLRTRQSHGAMKAPCHIPALASRAAFWWAGYAAARPGNAPAQPLLTSHFWMSSPSTMQRATSRPRRSTRSTWQVQVFLSVYLMSSSRAATPQVQRSPLLLRHNWSTDGASMPPSRIRVLPIVIWSPSRIFGTPVMSAACAKAGNNSSASAGRNLDDKNLSNMQ